MSRNLQGNGASIDDALLSELKAIKRLLALGLLQDGVGQQQVAKAAGVAKLAINQLANAGLSKRRRSGKAAK